MRKLPLSLAALMSVAIAIFAVEPISAEQEKVPVFVIGQDGGRSPFVIWRDSEEFKDVVFPPVAQAMARKGLHAIGEEPFRANFNVDDVPGECCNRWYAEDFLSYANRVSVDDAGNTAPYMVTLNIWRRVCRDEAHAVCVEISTDVYDTGSRERLFGPGAAVSIPIPPGCRRDCIRNLWPAWAKAILHPLGMKIATFVSQHQLESRSRTRDDAD